jgi:hypothetical protein
MEAGWGIHHPQKRTHTGIESRTRSSNQRLYRCIQGRIGARSDSPRSAPIGRLTAYTPLPTT